jgi:hypothetical protein
MSTKRPQFRHPAELAHRESAIAGIKDSLDLLLPFVPQTNPECEARLDARLLNIPTDGLMILDHRLTNILSTLGE